MGSNPIRPSPWCLSHGDWMGCDPIHGGSIPAQTPHSCHSSLMVKRSAVNRGDRGSIPLGGVWGRSVMDSTSAFEAVSRGSNPCASANKGVDSVMVALLSPKQLDEVRFLSIPSLHECDGSNLVYTEIDMVQFHDGVPVSECGVNGQHVWLPTRGSGFDSLHSHQKVTKRYKK